MPIEDNGRGSFHFQFWKEKVWVIVLLFPLAVVIWGLPIFLNFILDLPLGARLLVQLAFSLSYFGGAAIFYVIFSLVFSRVIITRQTLSIRTAWPFFPFLLVTKHIPVAQITHIQFMVYHAVWPAAIELTFQQGDKQRRLKIPQFQDSRYIQIIRALQAQIVPPPNLSYSLSGEQPQASPAPNDALIDVKRSPDLRPRSINMNVSGLWACSVVGMVCISGWITLSLPFPSKVDAFGVGFSLAAISIWLSFCGFLPAGIGQVAFWFLGRPILHAIIWLFKIPDVSWETPAVVNRLLAQWHILPVHSTLVEFTFWATLVLSIEFTVGNTVSWFRRRAYLRAMPSGQGGLANSDPFDC